MLRRFSWRLCALFVTLLMVMALPASAAYSAPSPTGSGSGPGATKQLKNPGPLKQLPSLGPFNRFDLFRPAPGHKLNADIHRSIWDPDSPSGRLLQPKEQFPQRRGPEPALHGKQGGPAQLEELRRQLAEKALTADKQQSQPAAAPGTVPKGTAIGRQAVPGQALPAGASQLETKPGVKLTVKEPAAAPIFKRPGSTGGTTRPLAGDATAVPALTLTPQILPVDDDVAVAVLVTEAGGVPSPGATVSAGGAEAITDENGKATLYIHTASFPDLLPVVVSTPLYEGVAGELYVVSDGYGVVTVGSVTDKDGAPIDDISLLATSTPSYYWTAWATWGGSWASVVMPTGTLHLEVTANVGSTSYYLYQAVEVPERQRLVVDLKGSETAHVTTTAQLDGVAVTGSLTLHNEAMYAAPSWAAHAYPIGPDAYVTRGIYTYSFLGDNQPTPLLVGAEAVNLKNDTAIEINQEAASLGTLALPATDGKGNSITLNQVNLDINPIIRAIPGKTTALLVSPDFAYTLWDYDLELTQGPDVYQYYYWSYGGYVWPKPGTTETIKLGGPLTAQLEPANSCSGSGCVLTLYVGMNTQLPDQVNVAKNGKAINGLLNLTDSNGILLEQWDIPADYFLYDVSLPDLSPGKYTLSLTYDVGPYQDPVKAETPLNLNNYQVTVSPNVVQPDTPTEIQVTVTDAAGKPLPDIDVIVGWYGDLGEGYTDASGTLKLTVDAPYIDTIPVQAMGSNGWNVLATDYLFSLTPDMAGVELNALDADGKPLEYFWVHTSYLPGGWDWEDWVETGPVPAIIPGDVYGSNYVELIREGNPAYFLSQTGKFKGGTVTELTWSAADMQPTYFTVGLDGQALESTVMLHGKMNHELSWFRGLYLDEDGQGVAYVAPGRYDVKIQQDSPENILVIQRDLLFSKGEALFFLKSADLSTLQTRVLTGNQEKPHSFELNSREFETFIEHAGTIRVTPDTYAIPWVEYVAVQPDGTSWTYSMARDPQMTVTARAGKPASYDWDTTVKQGKILTDPTQYQPWDWGIAFQLQPTTADGWYYDGVWLTSNTWDYQGLPQITITDAAGKAVEDYEDYEGNATENYFFLPSPPSDFYTITMKADLGVAGKVSASTKVSKAAQTQLTANTEILTVGKTNALVATLTRGGKPAKNEWVSLLDSWGNEVRSGRTNDKGQVTFQAKPTGVDYYILAESYGMAYMYLYALEPGWGLLDVKATDQKGEPLRQYAYTTLDGYFGYADSESNLKAIVPAGATKLIVYGVSDDAQFYLTAEAQVPDRKAVTVNVGATNVAPLQVNVTNGDETLGGSLYLRNKAFDYVETSGMPYSLYETNQIYATPGEYEAMVRVPYSWDLYLLKADSFNLPQVSQLNLDLSQAKAELVLDGRDGNNERAETDVEVRAGQFGTAVYYYSYDHIWVTPGTYGVDIADIYLYDYENAEYWIYEFIGMTTVEAKAGETATLLVGGPLTATIKTDQKAYGAGDKVPVTGAAMTGDPTTDNHLALDIALSIDDWWNLYLWPNWAAVENSSGQLQYMTYYFGSTWTWPSPLKAGTYNLYFIRGNGPYGPEEMQTSTWVNLTTKK